MEDFDLKTKILKNATTLFAEGGFNKTSIQKIADASSTSQTNVLYHFKTKKKMFEECLYLAISKNRSILESHVKTSDKENLMFLLETNIHWAINSPKDCQLFLLLYYFSTNDDYFREISRKITSNAKELLYSYTQDLTPINGFTHLSACSLLQNYIHGVMFNIIALDNPESLPSFKHNIDNLLKQLFS